MHPVQLRHLRGTIHPSTEYCTAAMTEAMEGAEAVLETEATVVTATLREWNEGLIHAWWLETPEETAAVASRQCELTGAQ